MAFLLSKFRIDYCDLVVITDLDVPPAESSHEWFNSLVHRMVAGTNAAGHRISPAELSALAEKSQHHIRLRELLLTHSSQTNLVVM